MSTLKILTKITTIFYLCRHIISPYIKILGKKIYAPYLSCIKDINTD